MPQSNFLDIQAGQEVVVEIIDGPHEQQFTSKQDGSMYSKWMYDVKYNDQARTLSATKGLQSAMSPLSPRAGDMLYIKRTGSGLQTRWDVGYERGDSGSEVRGPAREHRPSRSIDDYWSTLDGVRGALQVRMDFLSEAERAIMAAIVTHTIISEGMTFPGYGSNPAPAGAGAEDESDSTPAGFVEAMLGKIAVGEEFRLPFAEHLFGEHINSLKDVTGDDANTLFLLTEKASNMEPLKSAYTRFLSEHANEDEEEESVLPF